MAKRRIWTPEEYVRAIDAKLSGMDFKQIGALLGWSPDYVRKTLMNSIPTASDNCLEKIASVKNRPCRSQFAWSIPERAYLIHLSRKMTPEQISIVLGRCVSVVKSMMESYQKAR